MTTVDMFYPVPLSPKLEERRRAREARDRPWRYGSKDFPDLAPPPPPAFRLKLTIRTRSGKATKLASSVPTEPFPFMKLPFDIQVIVAEFAVQYKFKIKVSDFLLNLEAKHSKPKKTLNLAGQPTYVPLAQACPFLLPELSRAWYRHNVFYVKTVPDFEAFAALAGPANMNRIRHLQVENDLIYCTGSDLPEIPSPTSTSSNTSNTSDISITSSDSEPTSTPALTPPETPETETEPEIPFATRPASWRSHSLLTPLKSLRTLTLYRDDGGPETYTEGGNDEFNSVEWFRDLVEGSKSLRRIQFALYPWKDFDKYALEKSNMVAWIKEWEKEWDQKLLPRRGEGKGGNWFEVRAP